MIINSSGGSIYSFIAIHDMINILRCDVATCCVGKAMSCGQMLLISGKKGKRFITKNSSVLIHQIWTKLSGNLSYMDNEIADLESLQKNIFDKYILKYTKITKAQLKKIMSKDSYFYATQAKELGIVDHIITSPSVLYKNINI